MIRDIAKYIFGVTGNVGAIDRVAFWTVVLVGIAWWQLRKINATTRADFYHRFTESFFNEKCRSLIMLFNYDLLKFVKPISEDQYSYFELDRKLLDSMKIGVNEKKQFKDFYSIYDIDDELLGYFEDIGNYEKRGLLDIEMVYEGFASYIESIWKNKEIKAYIDRNNSDGDDLYEGFEYIYNKLKSFSEAKKNKKSLLIWKIKWQWGTLKNYVKDFQRY